MNSLYCYLASEGLIFLKRGYLPFISPQQLSEPWLQSDSIYRMVTQSRIAADDFRQHLQQQYQKLPQHLRDMVSFDYFVQQSQEKREQIERSMVVQNTHKQVKPFNPERVRDWRLLSLYEGWDQISLWHDSGAGRGLVLEFDITQSGFQAAEYKGQAQHFSVIKAVSHWQPLDDLYYLFHRPLSRGESPIEERAWRLARSVIAADRKVMVQGIERAMYRLPAKAIKRVVLGYLCSREYCLQVKEYLSQDLHYRHVKCMQAQLDPKTMRLLQVTI
ncbi:MAG: hypothetical protein HRU08_00775 [Oleispira sp.]|nr:hypothetical protein [Oleispira sp.]